MAAWPGQSPTICRDTMGSMSRLCAKAAIRFAHPSVGDKPTLQATQRYNTTGQAMMTGYGGFWSGGLPTSICMTAQSSNPATGAGLFGTKYTQKKDVKAEMKMFLLYIKMCTKVSNKNSEFLFLERS